ncbi:MAG: M1 family metallopeptidase [Bacteroidota bacterium]
MKYLLLLFCFAACIINASCQTAPRIKPAFTADDTLRGSLNANRTWWNVLRYDLEVEPDFNSRTIRGRNTIKFSGNRGGTMQIDLQQPLIIDSVIMGNHHLDYNRQKNICLVNIGDKWQQPNNEEHYISIFFHGKPIEAIKPPWDGGWIWSKDEKGRPWMSVACQGIGASSWYPCKDHQSDEPNEGASLTMIVPDTLVAVGNGRLISKIDYKNTSIYRWEVRNPINNYNLVPYIGKYESFGEIFKGEEGNLTCNYWVLDYELEKAKIHFQQVRPMLQCFEHWFGPYPFYEDGYKLVQSPHLGMEHQSAVAYGNKFINGYLGKDLSGTGWGNLWDFIIIHESGHEWFGNNITTNDIADMWVHEGFTNYSETIFTECQSGLKASRDYVQGIRKGIRNDKPITGAYGVNNEGSGDMYPKASNMIHTIRTIINNDSLFRMILRGLNKTYYHKTVSASEVETYVSKMAGIDFTLLFEQYLTTTKIPVVEWKIRNKKLSVKLNNTISGLTMPMWLPIDHQNGLWKTIAANNWTTVDCDLTEIQADLLWNKNFYVDYHAVNP